MPQGPFCDVYQEIFDVAVLGGGYAGLAAALAAADAGQRVLLVDPRGDLLWESGRCFHPDAGSSSHAGWRRLHDELTARGAADAQRIDGASAEVVATALLADSPVHVLYYALPAGVELQQGLVAAVIVATRSGYQKLVARQWIDATEHAWLLRQVDPQLTRPRPTHHTLYAYLQRKQWSPSSSGTPTLWPTERMVSGVQQPGQPWDEAMLQLLRSLTGEAGQCQMTHGSVQGFPRYAQTQPPADRGNVLDASAGRAGSNAATLGARYQLGAAAHQRSSRATALALATAQQAQRSELVPPAPRQTLDTEVFVAGAGTGGALAALAAARQGVQVICAEPLAFAGGIGSGGGIHSYYFGMAGGLQQEVDEAVKALMDELPALSGGPFNPDAKKIVLARLLRDVGVDLRFGCALVDVVTDGPVVQQALVVDDEGPLAIKAHGYVDGTGDGDLAVRAGARELYGRAGDGLPHAYSHSSGAIRLRGDEGEPVMRMMNFDAGWCDPTDSRDLTRARLTGIRQYLLPKFDNLSRRTYVAPAIGLRQSRQIDTDYILSLTDQIDGRRFDDVIGYTGCHYDNHAVDYEFESDEGLFWIWFNRMWRKPFACEMSYRMLLPRGLDNLWLASRCLGVSQDAHQSCRMQRDVQRVGEAAGLAAALAAKLRTRARTLPYAQLKAQLDASGALTPPARAIQPLFNPHIDAKEFEVDTDDAVLQAALAALDRGEPGKAVWYLYRRRELSERQVKARLDSASPQTSWLAAGICAMWGDAAAEPRLLHAITTREYGFGADWITPETWGNQHPTPLDSNRLAPNWLVAAAMLRTCGTARCVPALLALAREPGSALHTRASLALTLARLAQRGVLRADAATLDVLTQLETMELPDRFVHPQYFSGAAAERARLGAGAAEIYQPPTDAIHAQTREDHRWQLDLALAQARLALDLDAQPLISRWANDPRGLVRRAFAALPLPREVAGDAVLAAR